MLIYIIIIIAIYPAAPFYQGMIVDLTSGRLELMGSEEAIQLPDSWLLVPQSWAHGVHTKEPLEVVVAGPRKCKQPGCDLRERVDLDGYCCRRCSHGFAHGENCTGRGYGVQQYSPQLEPQGSD